MFNRNMGCIEIIPAIAAIQAVGRLIETWDVLKYICRGIDRRLVQFNRNMGCIEMANPVAVSYEYILFNRNMGCIEISCSGSI